MTSFHGVALLRALAALPAANAASVDRIQRAA